MTKTVDTAVITVRGIKILFIKSQLFIRPTPAGINIRGMVSRKKFPGPSTASSFTALRHSKAKSRKSPYTPEGIGNGSRTLRNSPITVSYTHLTLPTKRIV